MTVQTLIDEIVARLRRIDGVNAIVLGGSRARGTHTAHSDVDLGLYYQPAHPLDLAALNQLAAELDDSHRPGLVTPIGGWGPWINGGGWLTVQSQRVDFLYRDLAKVAAVVDASHAGQVEVAYQPGHPHAFISTIYMAELALCQPLWAADGSLAALRQRTRPYPAALKRTLLDRFTFEMDFSLQIAGKSVERADVAYAAGCCFRAVASLLQVLFAINEQYWMNEKGAVALAATFPLQPPQLRPRIEAIFTLLAAGGEAIQAALAVLAALLDDTRTLLPPA
jgi:predicted nucleotidyltransferase